LKDLFLLIEIVMLAGRVASFGSFSQWRIEESKNE
jgi:hypothetical protein